MRLSIEDWRLRAAPPESEKTLVKTCRLKAGLTEFVRSSSIPRKR